MIKGLAFVGLCAVSLWAGAEPYSDLAVGYLYNDNITYGSYGYDVRSESSLSARYARGYPFPFGDYGTATLQFRGAAEVYNRYDQLNNATFHANFTAQDKFGVGNQVPWYSIGVEGGYRLSADDLRDAMLVGLSGTVGKRFSPAFTARLGLRYDLAMAAEKVFDNRQWGVSADLDYAFGDRLLAFFGLARYVGDVVATTLPNTYVLNQSDAIVADSAFGSGRWAYRLNGTIMTTAIGANYTVNANSAVELRWQVRKADIGPWTNYTSNMISLNYLRALN